MNDRTEMKTEYITKKAKIRLTDSGFMHIDCLGTCIR